MNININNFGSLHRKGVYSIENLLNNKKYIGSTSASFLNRWNTHFKKLRKGSHPNKYLQNSWNKYGEGNFKFSIIEELEENILEREQFFINHFQVIDTEKGYNLEIDVFKKTVSENTKLKISNTLKERFRKGELIPPKNLNQVAWNKNKKCDNISKTRREIFDSIAVYNINSELIVIFRSCIDLCEWSEKNELPFIIKRKSEKNFFLRRDKIYLSIRKSSPYKGLYFKKVKPLHSEMGVAKWMNSWKAETPIMSQALSTLNEGAETT